MVQLIIPLSSTEGEFLSETLFLPNDVRGLIVFVHGSGRGRASPRNRYVAPVLYQNGFATLLVDLLTPKEQESDIKSQSLMAKYLRIVLNRFKIFLLSNILTSITKWLIANIPEGPAYRIFWLKYRGCGCN
jgi:hypothetical protein